MILNKKQIIFPAIILIYLVFAGLYIFRTSIVLDGIRYFTLLDDEMISMRFARNLVAGFGLAWNPRDAPVEGFSNPLWVLIMFFFHIFIKNPALTSLPIQILGALLGAVNLVFVKKIADIISGNKFYVSLCSVLFTATYLPLNTWLWQGTEVSLIAFLTTITVWLSIKNSRDGKFSVWQLIFPGIAVFVRMDAALIVFVFALFLFFYNKNYRKQIIWSAVIILFITIGSQTLFRVMYYGEFLPNTYYLKMTGYPVFLRISRGLYVYLKFIVGINPVAFILPAVFIYFNRKKEFFLLAWLFFAQSIYSIYAGGDAWEWWGGANRFIAVTMPLLFMLFALSLNNIVEKTIEYWKKAGFNLKYSKVFAVTMIVVMYLSFNSFHGLGYFIGHVTWSEKPFLTKQNELYLKLAKTINKCVKSDGKALVTTAGVIPYFVNCNSIDMLGKCDKVIAKSPAHIPKGNNRFYEYIPGHEKWDYSYSIGKLKPGVVIQIWRNPDEAKPFLDKYYKKESIDGFDVYLLSGSDKLLK